MIEIFLYILVIHYIADFICQTHWMATNKSKRLDALSLHVGTYTLVFFSCLVFFLPLQIVILYCLINGLLHFITDYITSRASSYFYAQQDWHNFFVVIGGDQLIHAICLGLTLKYMVF